MDRNQGIPRQLAEECVALRKESVDRNDWRALPVRLAATSLSARRAWIEMLAAAELNERVKGRSPQGERG